MGGWLAPHGILIIMTIITDRQQRCLLIEPKVHAVFDPAKRYPIFFSSSAPGGGSDAPALPMLLLNNKNEFLREFIRFPDNQRAQLLLQPGVGGSLLIQLIRTQDMLLILQVFRYLSQTEQASLINLSDDKGNTLLHLIAIQNPSGLPQMLSLLSVAERPSAMRKKNYLGYCVYDMISDHQQVSLKVSLLMPHTHQKFVLHRMLELSLMVGSLSLLAVGCALTSPFLTLVGGSILLAQVIKSACYLISEPAQSAMSSP